MHAGMPTLLAGRFTLGALLGRGGMGSVYLARDEAIGREVAIKVLSPGVGPGPEDLAWLRDEASALGIDAVEMVETFTVEPCEAFAH